MAKSKYTTLPNQAGGFANTGNATDESLSDVQKETLATLKQLNVEKAKGQKIDESLRKDLIEKLKLYTKEIKLRKEARDLVQEEVDGAQEALSIAKKMSRNQTLIRNQSNKTAQAFNAMEGLVGKIGLQLDKQAFKTKEGAAAAREANKAMGDYSSTVTKAMREFKTGKIDAQQLASRIKYAGEELDSFLDTMDLTNDEARKLYEELKSVGGSAHEMTRAFAEGKKAVQELQKGIAGVASEAAGGIPGASGLVNALSGLGTMTMIGGIFALGSALGSLMKTVFDAKGISLFGLPTEVQLEMNKKLAESIIDLNLELTKVGMNLGQNVKISGALQAQMAKLGVSGQDFGTATKFASNNLGLAGKNAQEAGADIAMIAARTGVSSEQLGGIANTFRIVGDLSGKAAVNSLGMAESMAKATGVPINALYEDLAESSELFLQNNYGNEQSLIKQVATLRVMGVAAQKVLQAGQKMVLNYKDSIKSEMQLSALLGRQVDLSRVRQKFASGDAAGAAQALQQQLKGIDLNKLNMFQRQALQEATGMDMDTIMKIGKGGKGGKLETEQQKQLGALNNIESIMTGIAQQFKTGEISVKFANQQAATEMWSAQAKAEQAKQELEFNTQLKQMLRALAFIAAGLGITTLGAGLFGKGPIGKLFGNLFKKGGGKAVTEIAETGVKTGAKKFSQKQILAGFAGKEARDAALAATGKTTASRVATNTGLTAAKGGFNFAKLGKGILKGGAIGLLSTGAQMAGDYFGGQREAQGMAEGDRSKVNQGKGLKIGAQALEYGGYGAAAGSLIGPLGTAVGGALGGVIGGVKGIWDNYFSEDAKKQEAALKAAEEKKKKDEETAKIIKEQKELAVYVNGGEEVFRAALMAQLLEMTRLLDILALEADSDFTGNSAVYLDGKKIGSSMYNKASALYAANSQTKPK